jgi:hypothetical protein
MELCRTTRPGALSLESRSACKKTGAAPLGHGAAMFTLNEEMSILATLLGLAQERKAGSIDAVVRVVEAMGMLSRWNRQNEDNDIASLRKRAAAWAKTRVRVWRKAGYITTRSTKPVTAERQDIAQQLADGKAFFSDLKRVFESQGDVVSGREKRKKKNLQSQSRARASTTWTSSSAISPTTTRRSSASFTPTASARRATFSRVATPRSA